MSVQDLSFVIPSEITSILDTLTSHGFESYLVGGAVRDLLLGRPVNDWDFTTNATPEKILEIFSEGYYNNTFGTVGIPSTDQNFTAHEITTFRTEHRYSDNRRPDAVAWGKTLQEDVARRDFTINALALEKRGESFTLHDFFGGQKDIHKKIIKAVGEANDRFSEDALRMMRAVRIAAELGFTIEEKTFQAIQNNAPLILRISKERVRDELLRLLASPHPYEGVTLLKETGLLSQILPELEKTFGVEQKSPKRHHIYDVGTHLLKSLDACTSLDPITRLATLIHDIGKPSTFKKLPNGVITFYNHEIVGTTIARNIAKRLRFSNHQTGKLIRLVRWHQFTVDERQTDSAIRRFIRHVGKENLEDMLALRVADRLGGGARETSWRLEEFKRRLVEVQKQPFTVRDLKINGQDVMEKLGIKPGPKVGEVLNQLYKEVVDKKIENEREGLLNRLSSITPSADS